MVKDEPVKALEVGEVEQAGAPYGVDRVDQAALPLDGRASVGPDFVGDGRNGVDCNGHGTHDVVYTGGATGL